MTFSTGDHWELQIRCCLSGSNAQILVRLEDFQRMINMSQVWRDELGL